jgi:thiol-disulfide isomerase/thioredoxin
MTNSTLKTVALAFLAFICLVGTAEARWRRCVQCVPRAVVPKPIDEDTVTMSDADFLKLQKEYFECREQRADSEAIVQVLMRELADVKASRDEIGAAWVELDRQRAAKSEEVETLGKVNESLREYIQGIRAGATYERDEYRHDCERLKGKLAAEQRRSSELAFAMWVGLAAVGVLLICAIRLGRCMGIAGIVWVVFAATTIASAADPAVPHPVAWRACGSNQRTVDITRGLWLLRFTAPWCKPCIANQPDVNIAIKCGVHVVDVNVDQFPALVAKYQAEPIPKFVLVFNGQTLGYANVAMSAADQVALWNIGCASANGINKTLADAQTQAPTSDTAPSLPPTFQEPAPTQSANTTPPNNGSATAPGAITGSTPVAPGASNTADTTAPPWQPSTVAPPTTAPLGPLPPAVTAAPPTATAAPSTPPVVVAPPAPTVTLPGVPTSGLVDGILPALTSLLATLGPTGAAAAGGITAAWGALKTAQGAVNWLKRIRGSGQSGGASASSSSQASSPDAAAANGGSQPTAANPFPGATTDGSAAAPVATTSPAAAVSPADDSAGTGFAKEYGQQLIEQHTLAGRDPVLDATLGRVYEEEIEQRLSAGSGQVAQTLTDLQQTARSRFYAIHPPVVNTGASSGSP